MPIDEIKITLIYNKTTRQLRIDGDILDRFAVYVIFEMAKEIIGNFHQQKMAEVLKKSAPVDEKV